MSKSTQVAIYARVSSDGQDEAMQLTDLREHAERRGWIVAGEYIDVISSTKVRLNLNKMMSLARRGKFDVVLVWRFDRFARSTRELVTALEELQSYGVSFCSHCEEIDTSGPLGKFMFTVISAFAEFERNIIVSRVRAGMAEAKRQGKRLGRPEVRIEREVIEEAIVKAGSVRAAAKALDMPEATLRLKVKGTGVDVPGLLARRIEEQERQEAIDNGRAEEENVGSVEVG